MAEIPCLAPADNECVKLFADNGGLNVEINLDRPQTRYQGLTLTEALALEFDCTAGNPRSGLQCGPDGLWAFPPDRTWCIGQSGGGVNGAFIPIPASGSGNTGNTVQSCFQNPSCLPVHHMIQYSMGPVSIAADEGDHIQVGFDYLITTPSGSSLSGRPYVEFKSGADDQCITFPPTHFNACDVGGSLTNDEIVCVQATLWYNVVSGSPQATVQLGGVNTSIWAQTASFL